MTNKDGFKILVLLTFMFYISFKKNDSILVKSPSGNLVCTINISEHKAFLSVTKGGENILPPSPVGLTVNGFDIGENVRYLGDVQKKEINEKYTILGNHKAAINNCTEVTIPLVSGEVNYDLVIRSYNDGIAFKYSVTNNAITKIKSDNTSFQIADSSVCYWAPFENSNEDLHQVTTFGEIPENKEIVAPLTIRKGKYFLCFTEAQCLDFPDMCWVKSGTYLKASFPSNPEGWDTENQKINSPWRLAIIVDDLTQLVNSDLVTNLCDPPSSERDFSWVKPGRALWQWWSIGGPKYEDQKQWYDAASELSWEYYLIDAGWKNWSQNGRNQWECLKEVIDYGKSKGLGTFVWVHSNEIPDRNSMSTYFRKIKQTGAVGIKIDFIPPATPEIMQWYEAAREETYNQQLMCVFHGCVKPTGLNRTWPHEITREAVRGNEYQITRYDRLMPRNQDVIIPFTRFVAGPADYTPVIFAEKEIRGYTWTHELAQALIFFSPLTHFADAYWNYLNNPAEDLLKDIPVVWDETIVLPCSEIGKVAAFAKRKGNEWWIGVMNGDHPSDISFKLDFLTNNVTATTLSDAEGAPAKFLREERTFQKADLVNVQLQPGGGYFIRMKPIADGRK
tara:strand:+ start:17033 stop:18889 length:1857 start_codon:yes stop_codon:yes gene_type:complete